MPKTKVAIPGSDRQPLPGARVIGSTDPQERIEVTVRLRSRSPLDKSKALEMGLQKPTERQRMTREEFERMHGAHPDDIAKVQAFAREHKLTVGAVSREERKMILSGTAEAFFNDLQRRVKTIPASQRHVPRSHGFHLCATELLPIIEGVFGLDNRLIQAKPHLRWAKPKASRQQKPSAYTPPQVGRLYDFPNTDNGSGQTIGIIELGGGYQSSDLQSYFSNLRLSPRSFSLSPLTKAPTSLAWTRMQTESNA